MRTEESVAPDNPMHQPAGLPPTMEAALMQQQLSKIFHTFSTGATGF